MLTKSMCSLRRTAILYLLRRLVSLPIALKRRLNLKVWKSEGVRHLDRRLFRAGEVRGRLRGVDGGLLRLRRLDGLRGLNKHLRQSHPPLPSKQHLFLDLLSDHLLLKALLAAARLAAGVLASAAGVSARVTAGLFRTGELLFVSSGLELGFNALDEPRLNDVLDHRGHPMLRSLLALNSMRLKRHVEHAGL